MEYNRGVTRHAFATVIFTLLAWTSVAGNDSAQCGGGQADILLILDSSASIGLEDYSHQLQFAADLTGEFTVGPRDIQFSALIFSTRVENGFGFTSHTTNDEVKQAILNLHYLNGMTFTGEALRVARTFSFTSVNGARSGVPRLAIVITDGLSSDAFDMATEASLLKNAGVIVMAIGVGRNADVTELTTIASSPSLVFTVDDYKVLDAIRSQIKQNVCEELNNTRDDDSCIKGNGCTGKRDGDYRACRPECERGIYYTCAGEYTYKRICSFGRYRYPNGTTYIARMVFNQESDTCQLTEPSCPRVPQNYSHGPATPDENITPYSSRSCLRSGDSCAGRQNGDYPICAPECQDGYFITCSNNERYVMPCALGTYTDSHNNTYTARMVFDAERGICVLRSPSCPRSNPVPVTPPAGPDSSPGGPGELNNISQKVPCIHDHGCVGKRNGNYRACKPECKRGFFYTCSHDYTYTMRCGFGWYKYPNGTRYTARMVFVQESNSCELKDPFCPRVPQNYSEAPLNPGGSPQCSGRADVLFILDSSASIVLQNYQVMKTFVAGLVSHFTVGPGNVQFSAIVFSDSAILLFKFADYSSADDVAKALLSAQYLEGNTDTAAALRLARQVAFSADSGAREEVGRVCILLTDGLSNNPNATATEADLLKLLGITVIAVGVGPGANARELQTVASSPSNVFEVDSFSVLGAVSNALVTTACNQNQSTFCITGSCSERADGNYPACNTECQQGYYYTCSNQVAWKMPCALGWYKYSNGTRFTARLVYDPSSNTCELEADYCPRDPQNFPVGPPITGNTSNDNINNGVSLCLNNSCVGKPNGNYPACGPDCKHGYYYSCSSELIYKMPCPTGWYTTADGIRFEARLVYNAETDSCEREVPSCPRDPFKNTVNPPSPDIPEKQQCNGVADILFILDSSSSVGEDNYDLMKTFVARLTTNFTLGPRNVQFSLIIFSNSAQIVFNFSRYTSKEELYQAIIDAPYIGGGTDTAGALRLARLTSFTPEAGARPKVGRVAIVFTDGISNYPNETAEESSLMKDTGVTAMSVGVGLYVNRTELVTIASAEGLVFEVDSFSVLDAISKSLVTSACNNTRNTSMCASNNCQGRLNGNYPACDPECRSGHYYSCSNELAYRMDCALAWYTFDNGTRFTARMVYNPTSHICEREVDSCQRDPADYVVPLPPPQPVPTFPNRSCLNGPEDCSGKPNGNYPICYPNCQKGSYYLCSNNAGNRMTCPEAWYTDSNQNQFTDRMVFDPASESCQAATAFCPRQVTARPKMETTEKPVPVCQALTDVLFIIDSSESIGDDDYSRQVAFVAELMRHFTIGLDHVLVSAILFSSGAQIQFNFTNYLDNAGLYQALLLLPYYRGLTDTAAALRLARHVAFTSANDARTGANKVAIVLTDGASNNRAETASEASLFKQSGVKVISIGIGPYVFTDELLAIASSANLVYNVTGYDVLTSIVREVVITTCKTLPTTNSTTTSATSTTTTTSTTSTTTTTTTTPSCVSGDCSNRPDGTYEACPSECSLGHYYVCNNTVAQQRTCDMVRYTRNGRAFIAPGVYDPVAKSCQSSSTSCPRNP